MYEDEGFSAKNLDRPQFRAMMKNARKSPFDCIVVYRLDRISRNVGDFANLIEELNGMYMAFICIKEQFVDLNGQGYDEYSGSFRAA